ncbi:hypothetical protein F4809DRAFT_663679 [Biscogniauxia mediterranea]|nr:hypothetical protein F4809DRAFT_663679 [Biscogniauxia mediterranea]
MESKICKKLDDLEASGKPISQLLQLPLPHIPKASHSTPRNKPPDPDSPSPKGWVSQHRRSAYARSAAYASRVELASLVLGELSMCHHPAWVSSSCTITTTTTTSSSSSSSSLLLPSGTETASIPAIELAIAELGARVVAAHWGWGCRQTAIRDAAQLRHFGSQQLPAYVLLTKLRLAVDQTGAALRACLAAVARNTEAIRRRLAARYAEHRRCYEGTPLPQRYRGLAGGKTSPLRRVVECGEEEEDAEPPHPPPPPPSSSVGKGVVGGEEEEEEGEKEKGGDEKGDQDMAGCDSWTNCGQCATEWESPAAWGCYPNTDPDSTSLHVPSQVTECF